MKANVDPDLWRRVNLILMDADNAGVALSTMVSGLCALLVDAGVCPDDDHARAHLAAVVLSPSDRTVGALLPLLDGELNRLRPN